ncbi:protein of unknown function DUF1361 [Fibrella aestuarina BUZ 2]|uniref:DUF1361 domain-containing protein n=1 Tax=Fibrella aestuarina BUZ 2 TaxID=1166018 RepID=I0K6Z8_9BACT|nr:DUF1361 domain-containing protein [Fibrella aestuarina]CCG99901.1 protein of unknown function DUF1361 [Fibrella aestuarina BUZ 2]
MLYPEKFFGTQQYPTVSSSQGEGLRALALLTGACLVMASARGVISHNWWFFVCLTWNLFLAWFPLGIMLIHRDLFESGFLKRGTLAKRVTLVFLAFWLLFMPNAPYIITDLFHLRQVGGELVYFDTLMMFLGALTGLLAGLYSTLLAHRALLGITDRLPLQPLLVWGAMLGCQALAGFGIYLGRFIRWNSWDLATNPMLLTRSLWASLHDSLAQKVSLTYGLGLMVIYVAFYMYANARRS